MIFVILSILSIIAEKIPYAIPFRMKSLFAAILFVWLGCVSKDKLLSFVKHKKQNIFSSQWESYFYMLPILIGR